MTTGNEAIWSMLRKECALEEMRDRDGVRLLAQTSGTGRAKAGCRLRARLAGLLEALGHRLEGVAAALSAERA